MKDDFYIGVDLGQAQDYTAFAVIEAVHGFYPKKAAIGSPAFDSERLVRKVEYQLRLLDRFPLGTAYTDIVKELLMLGSSTDFSGGKVCYVVDYVGVGRPVVDMMLNTGLRPITAVQITGGEQVVDHKNSVSVPKKDIVYSLFLMHRSGRLVIAEGLKFFQEFMHEVETFSIKLDKKTGNETFEAWRESDHDDLVLAVSLALWKALQYDDDGRVKRERQKRPRDYDPMEWERFRE